MGRNLQSRDAKQHLAWSDLVSYVMRYGRPSGGSSKVLGAGFGAGANIAFSRALVLSISGLKARVGGQAGRSAICGSRKRHACLW